MTKLWLLIVVVLVACFPDTTTKECRVHVKSDHNFWNGWQNQYFYPDSVLEINKDYLRLFEDDKYVYIKLETNTFVEITNCELNGISYNSSRPTLEISEQNALAKTVQRS